MCCVDRAWNQKSPQVKCRTYHRGIWCPACHQHCGTRAVGHRHNRWACHCSQYPLSCFLDSQYRHQPEMRLKKAYFPNIYHNEDSLETQAWYKRGEKNIHDPVSQIISHTTLFIPVTSVHTHANAEDQKTQAYMNCHCVPKFVENLCTFICEDKWPIKDQCIKLWP